MLSGEGCAGEGLIVSIERVIRNRSMFVHTATYLLQSALKQLVDPAIAQAGSVVDFDRLRFDFHCPRAVSREELERIEEFINGWITEAHPDVGEKELERTRAAGAVAMFGEKYGEVVRVVDVPGVSTELCGGTHVANTAEIGLFRIVAETGVAAGIRRIEAVAGPALLPYLRERDRVVPELADRFKAQPAEILERVAAQGEELRATAKELVAACGALAAAKASALAERAEVLGSHQLLAQRLDGVDGAGLQEAAQRLQQQLGEGARPWLLCGLPDPAELGKVMLVAAFGTAVVAAGVKAGPFIGGIARLCGGGGGGRPQLAQAGGRDGAALDGALAEARGQLAQALAG